MSSASPTFSYVFDIGDDPRAPAQGRVWNPGLAVSPPFLGDRPVLHWTEHTPAAWKLYAQVTLTAATGGNASAAGISFIIDRGLMTVLRPGDQLHVAALPMIGLSIVHDDFLVAAAGPADVLTVLPLGSEVSLLFPGVNLELRYFQQPGSWHCRPGESALTTKAFIEIRLGAETWIIRSGRPTLGSFDVLVRDSVRPAVPLVSIERNKICPETSAHTSAQLLNQNGFQIVPQSIA